jgi:phage protein D
LNVIKQETEEKKKIEAELSKSETKKSQERVTKYRKTGVKPEGWQHGTDDKLAKEEAERDARIKASWEAKEAREAENERLENERADRERSRHEYIEKHKEQTRQLKAVLEKRESFKEKIRISAEGMNDPFQDALIDYLEGLNDDNRRIEACYNIIKICKRIAVELQGKR